MLDANEVFKTVCEKSSDYDCTVKVKQGYDDISFRFDTIRCAADFAHTCLMKAVAKDGNDAVVIIELSKKEDKKED
jgi:hypothetical protein